MRKRLLLILAWVASVLLAGYVTLRLTAPRHRITEENIEAIKEGMTEKEVEAILGVSAGAYGSKADTGVYLLLPSRPILVAPVSGVELIKRRGGKEWVGADVSLYVLFDEVGRVKEMLVGVVDGDETFLDKLRRWLAM